MLKDNIVIKYTSNRVEIEAPAAPMYLRSLIFFIKLKITIIIDIIKIVPINTVKGMGIFYLSIMIFLYSISNITHERKRLL